ncbi:hypothetical protein OSL29_24810, partial [Escherichia coli]|nr:hypothetical protein [Escherichia coli]
MNQTNLHMLGYGRALPLQLLLAERSALPAGYRRAEVIRPFQCGFAPIFPDICYHLTHYKPAAADIPV